MNFRPNLVAVALAAALIGGEGRAQTAITSWTLSVTDLANTTSYVGSVPAAGGVTFQNTTYGITSFSGGAGGLVDSSATAAYVRRAGSSNNNSSVWQAQNGSLTNVLAINTTTLNASSVLLQNNVLMGLNDVFTNTGGSPTEANTNIERVNYYWAGGFQVGTPSGEGFAVFDRNNGTADGFKIAVFTAWDTTLNRPSTYSGSVITVTSANYGSRLDIDPVTSGTQQNLSNWSTLRFAGAGDSLGTLSVLNAGTANSQGVSGVFISLASLGIASGTQVYGYSVMATDVTGTGSNLVDWANATYYPTNTPDTVGSIDLVAGGRRIVPEPSMYGAIFVAASLGAVWWSSRRRSAGAGKSATAG